MDLADVFPPFGLRVEAGPVVLRPITDDLLPGLIELSMAGIHDPASMPFSFPWTDAPAEYQPFNYASFHWGLRSNWNPERWDLEFAVEYEGRLVGCQGFITSSLPRHPDRRDRLVVGQGIPGTGHRDPDASGDLRLLLRPPGRGGDHLGCVRRQPGIVGGEPQGGLPAQRCPPDHPPSTGVAGAAAVAAHARDASPRPGVTVRVRPVPSFIGPTDRVY